MMMSFAPPDIKSVPLADVVNKRRTVPPDSEFLRIGLSLGIYPGIGL